MVTPIRPQRDGCLFSISARLFCVQGLKSGIYLPYWKHPVLSLQEWALLNHLNCEFHRSSNIIRDPGSGFHCSITYLSGQMWWCFAVEYSRFWSLRASFET